MATPLVLVLSPGNNLAITQGRFGGFSHQGTNAYDLDTLGGVASDSYLVAPVNMTCVAYQCFGRAPSNLNEICGFSGGYPESCNNAYWFTSDEKVEFADGRVRDLTLLLMHTEESYNIGDKIGAGAPLYFQGNSGYSCGAHIHMEIMDYRTTAGRGNTNIEDAFYLDKNMNIIDDRGYDFKFIDDYVPPTPVTESDWFWWFVLGVSVIMIWNPAFLSGIITQIALGYYAGFIVGSGVAMWSFAGWFAIMGYMGVIGALFSIFQIVTDVAITRPEVQSGKLQEENFVSIQQNSHLNDDSVPKRYQTHSWRMKQTINKPYNVMYKGSTRIGTR